MQASLSPLERTTVRTARSRSRFVIPVAMLVLSALGHTAASAGERGDGKETDPWSGRYLGVNGVSSRNVTKGFTFRSDGTYGANAAQESASVNDRSTGAGLFLGTRTLSAAGVVLGVEADFSWLGHRARNVIAVNSANTWIGQPGAIVDYKTDWLGTARLSLGLPVGDMLLFGTGGLARAGERQKRTQFVGNTTTSLVESAFTESDSALRKGFALGGGFEWRFAEAWSMRAEYLHVRFMDETYRFPDARGGVVPTGGYLSVQGRAADNTAHMNLVRVGVVHRFGAKN